MSLGKIIKLIKYLKYLNILKEDFHFCQKSRRRKTEKTKQMKRETIINIKKQSYTRKKGNVTLIHYMAQK